MAGLSKVELLHLELDASAPCVVAADVLGALSALLGGLPHCSPASAAPPLRLLIGVPLAQPLPELEASALQNLLAGIGLLPRLTSVQVGGVGGVRRRAQRFATLGAHTACCAG